MTINTLSLNNSILTNISPNIAYYGERGVVNGIVLDIQNDIYKQRAFLSAIDFYEGTKPKWIKDVKYVLWFIEPSFSEFGRPDLIVIAETNNLKRYVVFIEAKLGSYDDSSYETDSLSQLPPTKASYDSIASKVNVQLAFKYRFSKAYANQKDGHIDEMKGTGNKYHDKNRRIHNRIVINTCNDYFGNPEAFYFVALTNDGIGTIPYKNELTRPTINSDNWIKDRGSFGLLTFQKLKEYQYLGQDGSLETGVINVDKGYFKIASQFMLGEPAKIVDNISNQESKLPKLNSINQNRWGAHRLNLANYLNDKIKASRLADSFSLSIGGKVVLKIVTDPENDKNILIGFRDDNIPIGIEFPPKLYLLGPNSKKRPFNCYSVGSTPEIDQLLESIEIFISRLEENEK